MIPAQPPQPAPDSAVYLAAQLTGTLSGTLPSAYRQRLHPWWVVP